MRHKSSERSIFFIVFCLGVITLLGLASSCDRTEVIRTGVSSENEQELGKIPLKIIIDQAGVYTISQEELRKHGFASDQVDLAALALSSQGNPVPTWVDADQQTIYFYGTPAESRYTRKNVYWLGTDLTSLDPAGSKELPTSVPPQDVTLSPAIQTEGSFYTTVHLEENLRYNPRVDSGDPWLGQNLTAPQSWTTSIEIDHLAPGPAKIALKMWSSTEAPISPDHHLRLSINQRPVLDQTWDGKGWQIIQSETIEGVLQEGNNEITIELPGDSGTLAETIAIDWLQIDYPIEPVGIADRLVFSSGGDPLALQGFSGGVDVVDISDPEQPLLVGRNVSPQQKLATIAGHRYFIVGEEGYLSPLEIETVQSEPNLRQTLTGADYLAVGTPELLEPMQELLDWRETQGLRTMAVPIQAIYDQFNHGMPDPQAVRRFLDYTGEHWQVKPRYLTLVGDASYDPKGYQTEALADELPPFFVHTRFGGETASDFGFSIPQDLKTEVLTVRNVGSPDIAVGRIPARSADQVREYVQKVLKYETTTDDQQAAKIWENRVLAIADGSEPAFKMDADNFIQSLPQKFSGTILASSNGDLEFNKMIQEKIDQGQGLIFYFGHGAINMWGKDRLFTNQNVADLHNLDHLPIIIQLTCLTGLFTHPEQESLSEAFLFQPDAGAVAVLAPTSLTLPEEQSYLSYRFMAELEADPQARLGEVLRRAQSQILDQNLEAKEVVETFLLFGDPALKISLGNGQ